MTHSGNGALLSVRDVHKAFTGVKAVNGVGFEIHPGEIFGFLGPNGAGKTTTLRMIMEITRPDAGEVYFDGAPRLDRHRIGYLPEERGLFEDAGVLDTLTYLGLLHGMDRGTARGAAKTWLERIGLLDRARSKVGTLSKGNQQKVQFAGAVLHDPALAVLDEPFAGLDPLNQELFLELIGNLSAQGSAVLISAHQLNLVERLCDRFCLISKGRVLLVGTLEEIRHAAAGGVNEVLVVDLRPSEAGNDRAGVEALMRQAAPGAECRIRDGSNGWIRLEASLSAEQPLSPVLVELGRRFTVAQIQTRPLSLHEIYVRAVGADHAPEPPAGVAHA